MQDKTVIITGATSNLGDAIAEHLHHAGMNIIAHYNTSGEKAHALIRRLNGVRKNSAMMVQANLEYKEYYQALIDAAIEFKGSIDVLINNASLFEKTPIDTLTDEQWTSTINTNLKAPLFLSRFAAPSIHKAKGCIINIADIHADRPLTEHPIYSISKAGIVMLTKSLAKELAPVRVNAISPGAITWLKGMQDAAKQRVLAQTLLKRSGCVEDIAKAVIFLIKDADYITGQVMRIDGGRTLYS